ncbi:peptide deformylase [Marispirochaeta aestuarii]|uniref:peptide deformylase n=1 Tax=Marispirochaeta aestuarii TaxID=1963862 RepID=UPI0029C79D78|nr:peptide deformylase [Marispirochaeta aestuarii]
MMNIVTLGDDVLREKSTRVEEFDDNLHRLIDDMANLMRGQGIGLAAPQVGVSKRLFICQPEGHKLWVFINPEITLTSEEQGDYEEGCLSIPGIWSDVVRPVQVQIQAFNEKGRPFRVDADGILARVIQHELDHLNGVLFIDHLSEAKRDKAIREYAKKSTKKAI